MKYVLDASVAYKWEVPEPDSDKANQIRDHYRKAIHELIAPDFFPIELGHALYKAERKKAIQICQAEVFWDDAMTTAPQILSIRPLIPQAISLASHMIAGVYDCLYVLLAAQEKCELIAADEQLVNKVQARFPFVRSLSSF
jgi:predicted nucleic acid-binding protein